MNEQREAVMKAVRALLEVDERCGKVVIDECARIATTIGNLMAPALQGSRLHGQQNAVSQVIRLCSEADFWLELYPEYTSECIASVNALKTLLETPTLR